MSAAKHFLHDPTTAVLSSLKSLTLTNPSLLLDPDHKIIYRHPSSFTPSSTSSPQQPQSQPPSSRSNVAVISGGGSGHEPGFAGFVGEGLLTACVCGTIFASPSAQQVRACLLHRIPEEAQGVLAIVTNYTGDVLNFGMGVEKARSFGKKVEMVVVGDDVGVGRQKSGKVGRRGLSGTAIVVKIVGALAARGEGLEVCKRVGELVVGNLVSVGASLRRVHVPGKGVDEAKEEEERLGLGMVELGMGIHNEPGCEKLKDTDLRGLVGKMLGQLLDQEDEDRGYVDVKKGDPVVLMINNFGGVSNLELGAITTETVGQLGESYGLRPKRIYTGNFFGSLDGPGFIITILKLQDTGLKSGGSMLDLLDAPCEAIGWPSAVKPETWEKKWEDIDVKVEGDENSATSNLKVDVGKWKKGLSSALKRVIAAENDITKYDTVVGDGDCGVGLRRGAEGILTMLEKDEFATDPVNNLAKITQSIEMTMDGTSGALYAIFFNSLVHTLQKQAQNDSNSLTSSVWVPALQASLSALENYTPAKKGDRTLMDALIPFIDILGSTNSLQKAAEASREGAEKTKGMKPQLGRTVYVGGQGWEDVPDPGAWGLSEFFLGLAEGLV